jgi:CRISPR-associated protein (TIGR03986 family)
MPRSGPERSSAAPGGPGGRPVGRESSRRGREELTVINAPYNFVPLSDRVVTPCWAAKVSHDVPFHDGVCGEIGFTLTARSPLLVGGTQIPAKGKDPGEVHFFRTPAGFAIPGSSLKGMIRAVLEIATFSRMAMVDDKRYGLRDISGIYVKDSYASRVRDRVRAGFLRLSQKGGPEIIPCRMARLSHHDIERWWRVPAPIFTQGSSVQQKYERWIELCHAQKIDDPLRPTIDFAEHRVTATLVEGRVTAVGSGPIEGFPVFTGQISDSRKPGGKYRDFVFHSREALGFALHDADPAAWRDFLFIHGDEEDNQAMSWPGHWKRRFWNREEVPVFYIRSASRVQLGLAYMPKLAGDFSIHDMIRHTHEHHTNETKADFATLIFGHTGERSDEPTPENTLKGRVWIEPAVAQGDPKPTRQPNAILSSPKPTYFPNYVCQPARGPEWRLSGATTQYATYLEADQHPDPRIRGWKRYPPRPDEEVEVQAPQGEDQRNNPKIQTRLNPLPKDTSFVGRLVFHNLKPEELGALLWCLDFGGRSVCRHGLGLGKPFGFGQVSLTVDEVRTHLDPNDPAGQAPSIRGCVERFIASMTEALGTPWEQTPQIASLLAMADPTRRRDFPGQLRHMVLSRRPNINQFLDAKQSGLVLASYVQPAPQKHATPARSRTDRGGAGALGAAPGPTVWQSVTLIWNKGSLELKAQREGQTAFASRADAAPLLAALSDPDRKKLDKGKLTADLTLEHVGGKNWKIVKLTPVGK